MAIFTLEEIADQMTVWKEALRVTSGGQSFRMTSGGTDRTLTMSDLPEIRITLQWLEAERRGLTGKRGPVSIIARPAR